MPVDEASVIRYITDTFDGVAVVTASDDSFFFYDPDGTDPADRMLPFATLVTGDRHDTVSRLDRPGIYRLNIGVGTDTYRGLFGPQPSRPLGEIVDTGHDFAALDQIMPHPVYASMSWVCVLNPSAATFEAVRPLLAEAHALAVSRRARRVARG